MTWVWKGRVSTLPTSCMQARMADLENGERHEYVPCYTDHFIRFILVVRHMSSIGLDGKLEPAFFQHILIGRVEHQPFHDGMDELEPSQHHAYMFT